MNKFVFTFLLVAGVAKGAVSLSPGGALANMTYVQAGANLRAAVVGASAGTTLMVGPGLYGPNATNLLKNGVNWWFAPGAVISNSYTADVGAFDNTYEGNSGAVTCIISGELQFVDNAGVSVGNIFRASCLTVSNPASRISFRANRIMNVDGDPDPAIRHYGGVLDFDVDTFDFDRSGSVLYWGEGNEDVRGRWLNMDAGSDAPLWCEGAGRGNWYLTGQFINSIKSGGAAGSIYFKPSAVQKLWLDCLEIQGGSVAAGYGGVLTVVTGKVYLTYQKLSAVEDTSTPRALIQVDSGEAWLSGEKMTITNNQHFVVQSGGKIWIRNQHYEDAGVGSSTRPYNYLVTGGTNFFQGGRADTTWGPFFRLTGGQTIIEDATINTFGTLQMSNNCLWVNAGSPVLKNVTLIPGGLYSISNSSGGALDFRAYGWVFSKSNFGVNVTWRPGQSNTVVDGTYVDR